MLVEVVHVHREQVHDDRDPCLILASFQQPDLDKFPPTVSEDLIRSQPAVNLISRDLRTQPAVKIRFVMYAQSVCE